jgi:hypothetical protein
LVIENRKLSNAIAERFGVRHQSPRKRFSSRTRRVVWHASHWSISTDSLNEALRHMPNRLINENESVPPPACPNPVDWYAWGPEALDRAAKEDKLISSHRLLGVSLVPCDGA